MSPQISVLASEALDLLTDAVEQIRPEIWAQPSNLEGWSLRDLVGHATGSAAKIVTLVEGEEVWGHSEPDDWAVEDPAARLRSVRARLQEALPAANLHSPRTSPQGEVPLRRALTFPVSDLTLHSWDIHFSQGQMIELPDDLLAFCQVLVESLPEDLLRRPGGFGQPNLHPRTPRRQPG